MKNILKSVLLFGLFTFVACSKDDKSNSIEPEGKPLTVEEGKQELENNSIEVLNKVNEFRDDNSINEIIEFLEFLQEDQTQNEVVDIAENSFQISTEIKEGNISPLKFPTIQKNILSQSNDDDLKDEFNQAEGTHTWNTITEDFDYVPNNSGKIIYIVNQNNKIGVMTISNFDSYVHASGESAPKSINISLTVDGKSISTMNYSTSIDEQKHIPNSINTTMSLGALSFEGKMSSNNTEGSISTNFKISDVPIIGMNFNGKGNYTDINNTGNSNKSLDLLVNSTAANFSIGNTVISFDTTIPNEVDNEKTTDEWVNLLNKNSNTTLSTANKKIADGEFYKKTYIEEDVYMSSSYNDDDEKIYVFDKEYNNSNRDDAIAIFNSEEEYEASEYVSTFYIYYSQETNLETNIITNDISSYIENKYPNGTYNGQYVYSRFTSSQNTGGEYQYTYDIVYDKEIILEDNIINTNIYAYDYVNNKYPNQEYQGNYVDYSYNENKYRATNYAFWFEDVEREEVALNFLFEDGTKSTMEAYFELGFEDLIKQSESVEENYSK